MILHTMYSSTELNPAEVINSVEGLCARGNISENAATAFVESVMREGKYNIHP